MVVWARVGDTQEARGFLVRSDSPGISIERTWDHLGLRASRSDDVLFADTPAVLTAGSGGGPLFMAWNSLGLTSLYLGVAAAARDWLASFLTERSPASLGRPLATLPRFQAAVGEIDASLSTAVALVDAMAARVDDGDTAATAQAPAVKLTGTRAAVDAVSQAVALVGNNGLTRHNPLERHLRDVLCARVHTVPVHRAVVSTGSAGGRGRSSAAWSGGCPLLAGAVLRRRGGCRLAPGVPSFLVACPAWGARGAALRVLILWSGPVTPFRRRALWPCARLPMTTAAAWCPVVTCSRSRSGASQCSADQREV